MRKFKFGKLKIKRRMKKGGVKITWNKKRTLALMDVLR